MTEAKKIATSLEFSLGSRVSAILVAFVVFALLFGCAPAVGVGEEGLEEASADGLVSATGPIPEGKGRVSLSFTVPATNDDEQTLRLARGVWGARTLRITASPKGTTEGEAVTFALLPGPDPFDLDLAPGEWSFAAVAIDGQGWENSRGEASAQVTQGTPVSLHIDMVQSTGDVKIGVTNLPAGFSELIVTADRPSRWVNGDLDQVDFANGVASTRLLDMAAGAWRFRVIATVPRAEGGFDAWVSVARAEVLSGSSVSLSFSAFAKVTESAVVFVPAGASIDNAAALRYHGTEYDAKWLELRLGAGDFPLNKNLALAPLVVYSGGWSSAELRGGTTRMVLAGTGQERLEGWNTVTRVEHLKIEAAGNYGPISVGGEAGLAQLSDIGISGSGWTDWSWNQRTPYIPIALSSWGVSVYATDIVADGGVDARWWKADRKISFVLRRGEFSGNLTVENMDADIADSSFTATIDPRLSEFPDEYMGGAAAYFRNQNTLVARSTFSVAGALSRDRFSVNGIQFEGIGANPRIELVDCALELSVTSSLLGGETKEDNVHVLLFTCHDAAQSGTFTAKVSGGSFTVRELPGGYPSMLVVSSALDESHTTVEVGDAAFRYLPPYPRYGSFVFLRRTNWANGGLGGGSLDLLQDCAFETRDWGDTSPYVDEVQNERSAWFGRVDEKARSEFETMLNTGGVAATSGGNTVTLVPFDWNLESSFGTSYTRLAVGIPSSIQIRGGAGAAAYFDVVEAGTFEALWGTTWEGPFALTITDSSGSTRWSGTSSRSEAMSLQAGRYAVHVSRTDGVSTWQTISAQISRIAGQ